MDLEDLLTGGRRRKYDRHSKHPFNRRTHGDSDDGRHSDSDDDYGTSALGRLGTHRHRSRHDPLRSLAKYAHTIPHFKWVAAILGVGLILLALIALGLAVMLLPMLAKALGLASQSGIQGAVDSVIPPEGVKGAIESVIPSTGLKGFFDSIVSFLQSVWYGKAA